MFWHGIDFNEGSTKFFDYSTNICVQPVIDSIIYQWYSVFRAKDKMNSQKCKCASQNKIPFFFRPFGAGYCCYFFVQGFYPWLYAFCPSGIITYGWCVGFRLCSNQPYTILQAAEARLDFTLWSLAIFSCP